ncbi:MAG: hypothetical protein ABJG15_01890 [Hyphomonadaceae bacterium]
MAKKTDENFGVIKDHISPELLEELKSCARNDERAALCDLLVGILLDIGRNDDDSINHIGLQAERLIDKFNPYNQTTDE